ncbi:glycosyl transferase [uncultured Vibrio sp.]|uniref:glycosyl transferase n=1 Tax=uncultured Vibrio sp. TaxID=114054 RepID=UPI0029C93E08|nr:glycosyl transferase [uncultured Vibrio sp.]
MSSSYNPLEKSIAKILSDYPGIKKIAKKSYSYISFLLKKKNYKYLCQNRLESIDIPGHETFFGYYDKSPCNEENYVLVYATEYSTSKTPSSEHPIKLYLYDMNTKKYDFITEICSYNWQQASRAQWINKDEFIFNDFLSEEKKYVSKIYSLKEEHIIHILPYPIQDGFKDEYFLSINYSRLMALRPDYGYRNMDERESFELPSYKDDGIHRFTSDAQSALIISIQDVLDFDFNNDPDYEHKLNHVMISPCGSKFIFMHRYIYKGKRHDRLILATQEGKLLKVLANNDMVSHCAWLNNTQVIGYLRGNDGEDGYWVIDIETGTMDPYLQTELDSYGDGHPTVGLNSFITDTYPDKSRMQTLMKVDLQDGKVEKLGEFFHGFKFDGETRCDLHPRMSHCNRFVFFDSVFSGKRQLYRMELPK